MSRSWVIALLLLAALGAPSTAGACTTFVLKDGKAILCGKNLDWFWSDGIVVVNQRGITKSAFALPGNEPARWVSKYGSVTFNQFGREMPFGGMNETGLVIEQMMLFDTSYGQPDHRGAISVLQWIQYQLDNCRSVSDVIATDRHIRIVPVQPRQKVHYLICDAAGDVATLEILDGRSVWHRGETLLVCSLTNDTYDESVRFLKQHKPFGGTKPVPQSVQSLHRFVRAAERAKNFRSRSATDDVSYAFQSLQYADSDDFTVWSIVYDIPHRKICFRTREQRRVRWVSLSELDFSAKTEPFFVEMNASHGGDIAAHFRPLTESMHRDYLFGLLDNQDFERRMGNFEPMIKAFLALLRSYKPNTAR